MSTKEFKDFILEQFNLLDNITYRPMMGEYLLYYNNVYFGGICDDRLLIKKVIDNSKYNFEEVLPYDNAKPMYLVSNLEDKEFLMKIVLEAYNELIIK